MHKDNDEEGPFVTWLDRRAQPSGLRWHERIFFTVLGLGCLAVLVIALATLVEAISFVGQP